MKKLAPLLIVGILVIALAMPASGFIICPMDEPTAEELVPTIVTTNVPLDRWATVYGPAMASFAHEAFLPVQVTSAVGDRRVVG